MDRVQGVDFMCWSRGRAKGGTHALIDFFSRGNGRLPLPVGCHLISHILHRYALLEQHLLDDVVARLIAPPAKAYPTR